MVKKYKYLYGPVPSRRLGLSLGIDVMPVKVCTLDCVYCQIGKTTKKTLERKEYLPIDPIIEELKQRLTEPLTADYITLSGSGEPTLNARFGELIERVKALTSIPIAVLTNGTLLTDPSVRNACARADIVIPSLDAADENTFQNINHPHPDIKIDPIIKGLIEFRNQYHGQIWLEVFFVEGMNTEPKQIENIKNAIEKIRPDKVQLNTAVRPTAEPSIKKVKLEKLRDIAEQLAPNAEVIADFYNLLTCSDSISDISKKLDQGILETLLSILRRRPCTLEDIITIASITPSLASKYIAAMQQHQLIITEQKANKTFYKAK
jgi:wyosine [tRNA(Phe)-imidazoG37] synthetase (radical SAM superfamily)